ncbi:MAG: hypothetical protein ACREUN_14855 [Burkholderiales bacterium]
MPLQNPRAVAPPPHFNGANRGQQQVSLQTSHARPAASSQVRNVHVAARGNPTLEYDMKKMMLSVALTALLASPAFAQATQMLRQTPDHYAAQRVLPGSQAVPNGYRHYGSSPGVRTWDNRIIGQYPERDFQREWPRNPVADY